MAEGKTPAKAKPGPLRRVLKLLARCLFWLVFLLSAGALFLLLMLPVVTNLSPVRNWIARIASQRLRNAVIEIKTLRVDPLRGKLVEIGGLSLAAKGRPDQPILQADRIVCHWSPLAALARTICITGVDVEGVSVHMVQEKEEWNINALAPTAPAVKLPFSFELNGICARNVSVEIVKQTGERMQIGPLWVACEGKLDGELCGSVRLWCSVEHARAEMPRETGVALECAAGVRALLARRVPDEATVKASCVLSDARVELRGTQVALPRMVSANLAVAVDLARIGNVSGEADVEVDDMARHQLTFRVERGDPWRLELDDVAEVDVARVGEFLRPTVQCLSRVEPLSRMGRVKELSLTGRVEAVISARGEIRPGAQPWLTMALTKTVVGKGLGLAASVSTALPGYGPVDVQATVEGLEFTHDFALAATLGDRLSLSSWEMADVALDRLAVSAGGIGRLECRDVVAAWMASDELPKPICVNLAADVAAGALLVESPALGRFESPLQMSVQLRGADLASAESSIVLLEGIDGSAGALLPAFSMDGIAEGYGFNGLQFGGEAVIDLAEARRLAEGLSDTLALGKEPGKTVSVKELVAGADVAGTAAVSLAVGGRIPRGEGGGLDVSLNAETLLEQARMSLGEFEVEAAQVWADFAGATSLGPGLTPAAVNAHLRAEVGPARLAASELEGGVARADATLDAEVSGDGLKDVRFKLSGSARGVSGALLPRSKGATPVEFKPFDVQAGCTASLDLRDRDVLVEDATVVIPRVMVARIARLEAEELGAKRFAASGTVSFPDLRALLELVPEGLALPMPLPEVSGSAGLEADLHGKVQLVTRMLSSAGEAGSQSPVELFPLKSFYESCVPVSGSVTFTLSDVSARRQMGEGLAVGLAGVSSRTHVQVSDGDVGGDFELSVPEVRLSVLRSPLKGFHAGAAFNVDKFDRLVLTDARLSALEGVITARASAEVSGLSYLRGMPSPAAALRLLDASVSGGCQVATDAISVLEGWKGSGGAGADFKVRLRGSESLKLECTAWLDRLNVSCPRLFSVEGLSARVPLSKEWRLVTRREVVRGAPLLTDRVLDARAGPETPNVSEKSVAVAQWVEKGFEPAVVRLLNPGEGLSVGSVSVLGRTIVENVGVAVEADAEALRVPRATLGVLGGRVLARMAGWRSDGAVSLYLESGLDGLDVRQMLPPELRGFSGDASVSGILRAKAELRGWAGGDAGNPIKDLSATLDVRHIGSEALNRALLVLDPKAENPAIMQIRGKLSLARPRRVLVKLERGFVSVDAELEGLVGSMVTSYSVPRFSVTGAFESQAALRYTRALSMLAAMRTPLDMLAAEHIVLNDTDGTVEFLR